MLDAQTCLLPSPPPGAVAVAVPRNIPTKSNRPVPLLAYPTYPPTYHFSLLSLYLLTPSI